MGNTNLADNILGVKEGDLLEPAYDFEDYKIKVNRYVQENKENRVGRESWGNKMLDH